MSEGFRAVLDELGAAERILVRPASAEAAGLMERLEGVRARLERIPAAECGPMAGEIRASARRIAALSENLRAFVEEYHARFLGAEGYTAEGRRPAMRSE